ncbi:MAG: c-type cytochrome [Gammaproteobacteria bacterium]|nr:c-type cytochrome [Gammaproteobacteria bacterium]
MRHLFTTFALLLLSISSTNAWSQTGEEINKKCALCHGVWSQGIIGGLYPRLAGLNKEYLVKAITDYKTGVRQDNSMNIIGGILSMGDQDIEKISQYLSGIDLSEKAPLQIPALAGNISKGKKLYRSDCKTCHGKKGEGKPKKDSPSLAGQYSGYLAKQITDFRNKVRHHDNDEDDETFDDFSPTQFQDMLAFISTLDD